MHGRPLSSIADELNNVLTVLAMCADEVERGGATAEAMEDMRAAVRRGAALTRVLVEAAFDPIPISSGVSHGTGPTVLVVEEDSALSHEVARALEGRGARVLIARNIVDAVQSLERARRFDVLVVDTTSSGRRFASQFVARYPGASVVYTGGYTNDEPLRAELPTSDVSLVTRPFATSTLIDCIADALGRRRAPT